jgi:1-acyl-sn-glycerol-3-phosphate acyltransferase
VQPLRRLDRYWRTFATGLSFVTFGLGSLAISLTLFPVLHLVSSNRRAANRHCQYVIHVAFRFLIWMMNFMGVLTFEANGANKLADISGRIVVANHPTLLDVVFAISLLPRTLCVVKEAAWSNPFLAGIMWATGYIQSGDPERLIDECVDAIVRGDNLLIFPEATRTVPGEPLKLRRGAATVIVKSRQHFIPLIIVCSPITLSKGDKWYNIPDRRMHFTLSVGEEVDPEPLIAGGEPERVLARRLNNVIEQSFIAGMENHERSGQ